MINVIDQLLGAVALFLALAAILAWAVTSGPGWGLLLGAVAVLLGVAWLVTVLGRRP